ncbi:MULTISPECIES: ATP-binding protein [unclassified Minwuia]|uniref:ATP-binding protein n=1 Tax=unclassified Minwuia TaxID=2618799 RepID=UPI00247A56A9|nr:MULTISPECIES: ATP-binding protein [unclassified Minwuia]
MSASPKSRFGTFPCDLGEVSTAARWVQRQGAELGLSAAAATRMAVAFEELYANSIHHGNAGSNASVRIGLERQRDGSIRMDFRDNGIYFDPVRDAERVTGDPIAGAVGGVGVRLAINLAREMRYTRERDGNHVMMVFDDR